MSRSQKQNLNARKIEMFRKLQQKNSRRHVVCVPATHHWVDHRRWQNLARRRDLTVNIIFEHRNKRFVSLAYTKSEKTNLLFCPSLRCGCIFVQLFCCTFIQVPASLQMMQLTTVLLILHLNKSLLGISLFCCHYQART